MATRVELEEIELLNVSQAAKLTRLGRDRIAAALDQYAASRGRLGLAFIPPERDGGRRMIRRASLRDWLVRLERTARYV